MSDGPNEQARREAEEAAFGAQARTERRGYGSGHSLPGEVEEAAQRPIPTLRLTGLPYPQPGWVLGDSGAREKMPTGSQRDSRAGKGRYDLMFRAGAALQELADLFEAGALKYEERNWEKGQPLSRYADSALRHIARWMAGDKSENHLIQACWNLLAAAETRARVRAGALPPELEDVL